ncbi:MAG: YbfB/YjiJ family MFS transporter, partial [Alphaproteobacteria bacterium]|nr:YbfB/YjiJ family MFS transporter [Alphaproteobacteria bacterium]
VPAWMWLPGPDTRPFTASGKPLQDLPPPGGFLKLLLAAYFCAGYGYVISATFIVAIVERQPDLAGQGNFVFLIVGLVAAPAVLAWDRLARRTGVLPALILAYGVQAVGIVLPAVSPTLSAAMASAVLYGATFVGCVSLVLTMAGRFYPTKPAKLMGTLTLAYGAAQILAPALTGMLAEALGSYDLGLWLAGGFVAVGAVLIAALARMETPDALRS